MIAAGCGYGSSADAAKVEEARAASRETGKMFAETPMEESAKRYADGVVRQAHKNKDPRGWREFADRLATRVAPVGDRQVRAHRDPGVEQAGPQGVQHDALDRHFRTGDDQAGGQRKGGRRRVARHGDDELPALPALDDGGEHHAAQDGQHRRQSRRNMVVRDGVFVTGLADCELWRIRVEEAAQEDDRHPTAKSEHGDTASLPHQHGELVGADTEQEPGPEPCQQIEAAGPDRAAGRGALLAVGAAVDPSETTGARRC